LNDSASPNVQFSLRGLLIAMVVAAAVCWLADRYISDRAHFKILETDLRLEGEHVAGAISFRCSRWNDNDNIEYSNTVLYVKEIANTEMLKVEVDDQFNIRYRARDFGPIANQNPYVLFMIRELGIKKEEIIGFVQLDGWAEVHVRGKSEGLP